MLLNSSLEITVLELLAPALSVSFKHFCRKGQLPQSFFSAQYSQNSPLFSIGEYIPLKFSLRAVMGGLGHNKKVNAQSFQHPVCQREVIGGVCRSGVQRNDIFMDIL